MAHRRRQIRGIVLAEDKRTERFFRKLLKHLGFGRFFFFTAPKGRGSGEAWVLRRFPDEVRALRSKNYQKGLCLVAVRDGDGQDANGRRNEMDKVLAESGLAPRKANESIALPVPCRNIETWLLDLLGDSNLDETTDYKKQFERKHAENEGTALEKAAKRWGDISERSLPSLRDGTIELRRIEQ